MENSLSTNVHNDFDWLESELDGKDYLVGEDVTAADILMGFNIEFIFARKFGTEGRDWPDVKKWLDRVQQREAYKKAVDKSGYSL